MPRDEVDPSLITNEPRKRKLASYVTNKDTSAKSQKQWVALLLCNLQKSFHSI